MMPLSALYQRAASEFVASSRYDSPAMQELTAWFRALGRGLFEAGDFQWSAYNKGQWSKFVQAQPSAGGASAFSLHPDGDYQPGRPFQGLYLCNTSGQFPYHTMALGNARPRCKVADIAVSLGYARDGTD